MSQRTLKRMKWTNRKAKKRKMGRKIQRQAKSDEQKSRIKMEEWKNNNSSSKIHGISIKLGYMHVKEIYMVFFSSSRRFFRSRLFASVLYLMRACNVLTQRHSARLAWSSVRGGRMVLWSMNLIASTVTKVTKLKCERHARLDCRKIPPNAV